MTRLSDTLRATLAEMPDAATTFLGGDFADGEPDGPDRFASAAVLVAITDRAQPGVLLTERHADLKRHAGQIAFPGGRVDPEDEGPVAAALREADEEIGLQPDAVDVVGVLDRYRTGTGFDVTPVIGVIPPDLPLVPAPAEVEAVFEVPFAFLLDTANHVRASARWRGRDRRYYEIQWEQRRIWGATAAMIVNLSRRLRWAP